ncbi:MAG TPA: glycosyltransferase family 4 protein [Anaerolineales bacterium]|nr:glycosyltransferase family 4 protein [Anaerolineales bacterium]
MKIALLTEKYTPDIGGLAISTERFARLLSSAAHEVHVFAATSNLSPSEKRTLSHDQIHVTRFGAHKRVDDTLVDWFELVIEEHHRNPFDVLHAYFLTQAGFIATYAGRYLNIPSVVSIRGNDIERAAFDPSKFSHVMFALQNASAVTANAKELVDRTRAFVDREIVLIPNGIDTDHFKPSEKIPKLVQTLRLIEASSLPFSSWTTQTSPFHHRAIGFAGELREKKGLKTLLAAYAQVCKKHSSTSLLIVGVVRPGGDKEYFDDFRTRNPNLQIIVTGHISPKGLPNYYALMDVFVHPSLRDGMPNALLEAMACGKPVVTTPVGGMLDVIKDGENGIFVPVNDSEALSNAIEELLNNAERRNQLGTAARQTILDGFSPQKELEANLAVYRKLGLNP